MGATRHRGVVRQAQRGEVRRERPDSLSTGDERGRRGKVRPGRSDRLRRPGKEGGRRSCRVDAASGSQLTAARAMAMARSAGGAAQECVGVRRRWPETEWWWWCRAKCSNVTRFHSNVGRGPRRWSLLARLGELFELEKLSPPASFMSPSFALRL